MRRTLAMCEYNVECVNNYLYKHGYWTYYHIAQRNGYKALDKYKQCDKCVTNDEKCCEHDTLVSTVGCYTTGELYNCTRGMREMVSITM